MAETFRSPLTNARYTRQLFWECQQELPLDARIIPPMYTLYHDKPGLINLRKAYVEMGDPTGYKLGVRYFEDYSHFQLLMKAPWFRKAKEVWDIELDAKTKSEGLDAIRMFADGIEGVAPAVQLTAARYLADLAFKKKESPSRGRPSKVEVEGELKKTAAETSELAADLERIRSVK